MDIELEPVAFLEYGVPDSHGERARIPVFDMTGQRNVEALSNQGSAQSESALFNSICMTCDFGRKRRVTVGSITQRCDPETILRDVRGIPVSYRVYDCDRACQLPPGRPHKHDGKRVRDSKVVAIVQSCGWQPRKWFPHQGCTDCVHFTGLVHGEHIGGRFPKTPMRGLTRLGGFCDLPDEGVDITVRDKQGREFTKRVHCAFTRKPNRLVMEEPSCANCENCVRPPVDLWEESRAVGLVVMDNTVVRTGTDPLQRGAAKIIWHRQVEAHKAAIKAGEQSIAPKHFAKQLKAINDRIYADESGLISSYRASVLNRDDDVVTLRFPGNRRPVKLTVVKQMATMLHRDTGDIAISPDQVYVIPSRAEDDVVVVEMQLQPWRRLFGIPDPGISRLPRAMYPGSSIDIRGTDLRTPGTIEPGGYVCLAHLHGLGGVDLHAACGWRHHGEGRWDIGSPTGRHSDSDRSMFQRMDEDDFVRANDEGSKIQQALDATDMVGDRNGSFWDPRNGTVHTPPTLSTVWRVPVHLDIDGNVISEADLDPVNGYDTAIDRQEYVEWLDTIGEVDGVWRSNRFRAHGYSLRAMRARKGSGQDPERWVSDVIIPEEEIEIDLRDEYDEDDLSRDDVRIVHEGAGLDFRDRVSEEEPLPFEWVDVYCHDCQDIVGSAAVTPNVVTVPPIPHDPAFGPGPCYGKLDFVGITDDPEVEDIDDQGRRHERRFGQLCINEYCGYWEPVTPARTDMCPSCGHPMVAVDERMNFQAQERARGALVWRSSDDKIRREQLEHIVCRHWIKRGSCSSDKWAPITLGRRQDMIEENNRRRRTVEEKPLR